MPVPPPAHVRRAKLIVRSVRFTEETWGRVRARANELGVPPAKFIAVAADRAAGGAEVAEEIAALGRLEEAVR